MKLFLVFFLFGSVCFAQERLNNQSVVELLERGFGSEVVIAKIKSSIPEFDTTIEALTALKDEGVPNDVLAVMIEYTKAKEVNSGIFFNMEGEEFKKISPTNFAGTKTSYVNSAFTYGLASNAVKSYIHNQTSGNNVPGHLQLFKFIFSNTKEENLGEDNWWFSKATHPKDFVLIELTPIKKNNNRELKVGKVGGLSGHQTGIDSKDAIPFVIQEEAEKGVFKVRPQRPLKPGEYAFFFQGTMPLNYGFNNQSVFTFTVVK